jgi:hypothetical protein
MTENLGKAIEIPTLPKYQDVMKMILVNLRTRLEPRDLLPCRCLNLVKLLSELPKSTTPCTVTRNVIRRRSRNLQTPSLAVFCYSPAAEISVHRIHDSIGQNQGDSMSKILTRRKLLSSQIMKDFSKVLPKCLINLLPAPLRDESHMILAIPFRVI